MKHKKLIISLIIIIIVALVVAGIIYVMQSKAPKPEDTLSQYFSLLNDKKYDEMYNILSSSAKEKISQEDFVKRNKNIYEGIDAYDIKNSVTSKEKDGKNSNIKYDESMSTSAGNINFSNTAKVVKEDKTFKIDWASYLIFPELRDSDKVRVASIPSKRGEILDRNGNKLAENGSISSVGIVPGKLGDNKTENINKISELTGVSTDYINTQISASYVKDDTFVPIKKISADNTELKNNLLEIPGVKITSVDARVYPFGEETAHLIGYVQPISAEELKAQEGKGYNSSSIIGKAGLEQAYEDTLRGKDGTEIYIVDEQGNRLKTLAKQDKQDGTDVKLTIDYTIQNSLYNQMKDDKGFFVVMNPTTGELLALVSTPSYDSNDFVLGITNTKWNELNNDTSKPLYNRFLQSYCPGSTFKPITAAIGLTSGKLTTDTTFSYTGLKWQKDSSWGNDYVTTLTSYNGTKNIENALIHSDNIFFAQSALQIGQKTFCDGLDKIGFNEDIDQTIKFPLTFKRSQYSNSSNAKWSEKKLADSGYGQGDILVNPIHMASIYSAFSNNGNMVKPYINYNDGKSEYLKENVFSEDTANTIKNDLIQVVENPEGTANDMKVNGVTIAGKTGTAELKDSSTDTESGTLGWFDCFTVGYGNGTETSDMLIIGMVENTQNNSSGGSHYLIKKIRTLFVK